MSYEKLDDLMLKTYPKKVYRKRDKSIVVNNPDEAQEIQANIRTIPGMITQRGCTYAGCKGVILGPTRDIVNITHGPIGCGFYSWLTRRNQTRPESETSENYIPYSFSTDMQDSNIVFGGENKLKEAIQEAYDMFHPKGIAIFSTCPVGLIGDDVHAVAREMKEKLGDCNVFGFSCEGYKGVSQSAGHHIANNQIFKHVVGLDDSRSDAKFRVNLLGEYNIGGDAFVIEKLFDKIGVELVATFSGNSTINSFENSHTADLNLIMCHRSINYVAEMMEKKYGIPWQKVNFIGAEATAKSLRRIGEYFEDEELINRIEEVIKEEQLQVDTCLAKIKPNTLGKTTMLFVGASRAHHYQELFNELGMETLAAGYEFAHRDDYEGRAVIPSIKIDADSRNIEELHVEKDPVLFSNKLVDKKEALMAKGIEFSDYDGIMSDMKAGSLVIDDISHFEMEKLIEMYKPDVFCAGIKEKFAVQKMGVPLKQLHSYDYGGPYAGFEGAVNFYKDIERMVNSKVWSLVKAPWITQEALNASMVKVH
ncbi:MAG: nitrogenase molybdenum-iron protein alpha chain [Spirochaetales bacterium]|nr:nitrogenase molybdenum-iron protein alpha chain [Spirochaetales bacterium]